MLTPKSATTTTVVTSGPEGHTSVTQHDPGASSTTTNSMESLKDRISEKFRGGTNANERGGYRDEGSGMSHSAPQVPVKSSMRERSPNPQSPRSPTGGSNFSYPSRTPPPQGQGYAPPGMGPTAVAGNAGANGRSGGGTLQGLKSAAVGLHVSALSSSLCPQGCDPPPPPPPNPLVPTPPTCSNHTDPTPQGVGETLRGTVNSSVDRRFKASPEAIAAHESVVRAGQEEMNSGRLHHKEAQVAGQAGGQVGHTGAKGGILKSTGRDASGRLRVVNE